MSDALEEWEDNQGAFDLRPYTDADLHHPIRAISDKEVQRLTGSSHGSGDSMHRIGPGRNKRCTCSKHVLAEAMPFLALTGWWDGTSAISRSSLTSHGYRAG